MSATDDDIHYFDTSRGTDNLQHVIAVISKKARATLSAHGVGMVSTCEPR